MEFFKKNKPSGKLKDLPEETRKYVEELEEKVWKVIPQSEWMNKFMGWPRIKNDRIKKRNCRSS